MNNPTYLRNIIRIRNGAVVMLLLFMLSDGHKLFGDHEKLKLYI
jgi:hypothetical protein